MDYDIQDIIDFLIGSFNNLYDRNGYNDRYP